MKYLYFNGYPAGLSNNKMALDIGVGLAYLTNRTLVYFNNYPVWPGSYRPLNDASIPSERPTVIDLYDTPIQQMSQQEFLQQPGPLTRYDVPMQVMTQSLFYFPSDLPIDDERFHAFRNGRQHAYTITPQMNEADVVCINGKTLGLYSHSFYLHDDMRSDFIDAMKQVVPKAPYRKFAADMARFLGDFNAVHIRRGDFLEFSSAPRTRSITAEEILENIREVLPVDEPLVICTDESWNTEFFKPILDAYKQALMIDRYILGNKQWFERFNSLPFHDDVVVAFLSQLVACSARKFVGTLCSTFTGLVHRSRGFELGERDFLFAYNQFDSGPPFEQCTFSTVREGHFSWNRFGYPVPPNGFSWFREWPEAFD